MEYLEDIFFDPQSDSPKRFYPGTYPAYISNLTNKFLKITGKKENNKDAYGLCEPTDPEASLVIFDYTFRISEEAGNMTVEDPETKEKVSCEHMVGKEFQAGQYVIPTLNLKVTEDDKWKNSNYILFHSNLGIKFPRKNVNGKEIIQLAIIEHDDVFGIPVWITLRPEKDRTDPEREYMKVFNIRLRDGVQRLTPEKAEENELPF